MSNDSTGDPVGQFTFQGTAERLFGRVKGVVFSKSKGDANEWKPYGGAITEDTLPSGYEYTTGENWYWLHNLRAVGIEEKQSIVEITMDARPEPRLITVDPTSSFQLESGAQIGTAYVPRQPPILAAAITLRVDDAGENAVNVTATCAAGFEAALNEIVGYILEGQVKQRGTIEDFASLTDAEFTERQGRLKDRYGYATSEWNAFVFGFYYARKKQNSRAVSIDKLAELTGDSPRTIDRQKRVYDEKMRVKT